MEIKIVKIKIDKSAQPQVVPIDISILLETQAKKKIIRKIPKPKTNRPTGQVSEVFNSAGEAFLDFQYLVSILLHIFFLALCILPSAKRFTHLI